MNKRLSIDGISNELKQGSAFFPSKKDTSGQSNIESTEIRKDSRRNIRNNVRKDLSANLLKNISTEEVEKMAFQLRRKKDVRVTADIPKEWKYELDELTLKLGVGKYDLLLYLIGKVLGKV